MKKLFLALSIAAISLGANASVQNDSVIESVRVDLSDINVTTQSGQEKVYERISRAAKTVCGSTIRAEVSSIKVLMENRSCIKQATAEAVADTNASLATR